MRLGILIPYRDREANLQKLVPHLLAFFATDPVNLGIEVRILIVEQAHGLPFNRGAILNAGYQHLAPDVDYVCFHDVDYLPVAVDYGWCEQPTMLIFHGLPHPPEVIRSIFSGVVLMRKSQFEAANGFPNAYWGWGFEDVDLRERLLRIGARIQHQEGTFTALPHADNCNQPDGTPSEAHLRNQRLYISRWLMKFGNNWRRLPNPETWRSEGLNSLAYAVLREAKEGPVGHMVVALPEDGSFTPPQANG